MTTEEDDFQGDEDYKSKSQLKREMHALQDLGKRLIELRPDQVAPLPISDRLRAAIDESRRITQREARRRHLQYIGKAIRQEEQLDELIRAIEAYDSGSAEHTRRQHLAERWRDRLIAEGDALVGEFIDYCPSADIQHLRNLTRNARRDAQKEKNTGQAKKLFRYLRECVDEQENPS
ncbi:ribosome biogenesis factor YjgA [Marinobacter fonticola]|uniref:ribosome biogenesis factor YjgA n=1 Tax=Marinobacter fonticola TaxID=2603215 RepID=UPI0011E6581F|nr:ribosome biogenesis factor YjgA [Marinobacter fonticola]